MNLSKKCSSCEGTDHQRPNSRKCPNFGTKATKSKPEAKVKQESEETKPKICSSCGFYGHKTSKSQHCPKNVLSVDFDEVPLLGNPLFESFVDYSVEQTKIQQKWDANEPEPWSDKDYDMVGVRYEAWCSLSDGKKSVFKGRDLTHPAVLFNLSFGLLVSWTFASSIGYVDDIEELLDVFRDIDITNDELPKKRQIRWRAGNQSSASITPENREGILRKNWEYSERVSGELFREMPTQREVYTALLGMEKLGPYLSFYGSCDAARLAMAEFDHTFCIPSLSAEKMLIRFGLPKNILGMAYFNKQVHLRMAQELNNGVPGKRDLQEEIKFEEKIKQERIDSDMKIDDEVKSEDCVSGVKNEGGSRVSVKREYGFDEKPDLSKLKYEGNLQYAYLLPLWPVEINDLAYRFEHFEDGLLGKGTDTNNEEIYVIEMNDPKKLKSVKPKSRKRSKRDVVDESGSEEMMDDGDGVNDSEDEEIIPPRRTYKTRSSAKKKRQEHNKFTSINDLDTSEIDGDELVILLSDYEE